MIAMRQRRPHGGAPSVARGDGSGAVRAPAAPQLPDPSRRITGVVVDGAGVPVAGAEVSAELEAGFASSGSASGPTSGASAVVARDAGVLDAGVLGAGIAAPPTGADGRFVLGGVEPGRYRL